MIAALADIVHRKGQQARPAGQSVDWDDRRDRYLAAVADLYAQVQRFLEEPIAQGTVVAQTRSKQLTESYLGTYAVDDLRLVMGDEQVLFSPVGRNIAGAIGRVDVVGERGEATLLLQPPDRWGFVQTRQPTLRSVPFDESAFAEILNLVMRD